MFSLLLCPRCQSLFIILEKKVGLLPFFVNSNSISRFVTSQHWRALPLRYFPIAAFHGFEASKFQPAQSFAHKEPCLSYCKMLSCCFSRGALPRHSHGCYINQLQQNNSLPFFSIRSTSSHFSSLHNTSMSVDSTTLGIALGLGIPLALLCVLFDYFNAKARAEEAEQRLDEETGRPEYRIMEGPSVRVVSVPASMNKCPHCLHCYPTTATPPDSLHQSHPSMSDVDYTLPSYTENQGPLLHPCTNISSTHNSLQLVPSTDSSTSRSSSQFQRPYPMLHPGLSPAPPVSRPLSTPSIFPAPQL